MRKLYFKSYVLNTRNTINGVFLVTFDSHAEHGENYVGGACSSFLRHLQVYGIPGDS